MDIIEEMEHIAISINAQNVKTLKLFKKYPMEELDKIKENALSSLPYEGLSPIDFKCQRHVLEDAVEEAYKLGRNNPICKHEWMISEWEIADLNPHVQRKRARRILCKFCLASDISIDK